VLHTSEQKMKTIILLAVTAIVYANTWYSFGTDGAVGVLARDEVGFIPAIATKLSFTKITSLSTGDFFSIFRSSEGKLYSVGANNYGQLGDGSTETKLSIVPVLHEQKVTKVSSGSEHSLAITETGTVLSWGANYYGQLGDTTQETRTQPVVFGAGITTIVAVSAGFRHSLVLTATGEVYGSGYAAYGELGAGNYGEIEIGATLKPSKARFPEGVFITAIAAGAYTSLALDSTGQVYGFGENLYGGLGFADEADRIVPVAVPGLTNITAISSSRHSIALTKDGRVLTFGNNYGGAIGKGTDAMKTRQMTPFQVTIPEQITEICTGVFFSLARSTTGRVYTWGAANSNGYSASNQLTPVMIPGLENILSMSAGASHTFVLKSTPEETTTLIPTTTAVTLQTTTQVPTTVYAETTTQVLTTTAVTPQTTTQVPTTVSASQTTTTLGPATSTKAHVSTTKAITQTSAPQTTKAVTYAQTTAVPSEIVTVDSSKQVRESNSGMILSVPFMSVLLAAAVV
jgi:alpha-tubulin suppressor-like RCC1 family protein